MNINEVRMTELLLRRRIGLLILIRSSDVAAVVIHCKDLAHEHYVS